MSNETKPPTKTTEFEVTVHFGAEHTKFEAPPSTLVGSVRERALVDLHIVVDPAFDYLLNHDGVTEPDTSTLENIVGGSGKTHVEFHIKKRPKGG